MGSGAYKHRCLREAGWEMVWTQQRVAWLSNERIFPKERERAEWEVWTALDKGQSSQVKSVVGPGGPGGHVLGHRLRPRLRMESEFSVERRRFFGGRRVGPGHTATPCPAFEPGLRGRFLPVAVLPKRSPGCVSSAPRAAKLLLWSRLGRRPAGAAGRRATGREMEGTGTRTGESQQPHRGQWFCPPPRGH